MLRIALTTRSRRLRNTSRHSARKSCGPSNAATAAAWPIDEGLPLAFDCSRSIASISQAGAVAAFEGPQDFLDEWREVFRKRRDLVVKAIRNIPGLSTAVPDGAFYCFVNAKPLMKRFGGDDTKLAMHLLEHGVAVVAASAFGGRDGFRISFAADETVLEEAMARIAAALRE